MNGKGPFELKSLRGRLMERNSFSGNIEMQLLNQNNVEPVAILNPERRNSNERLIQEHT